jgi:transposase-like protein
MRETFSTVAPVCPYCEHQHEHDDGFFYDENLHSYQCESCGYTFDMSIYTSTSWSCTAREEG